MSLLLSDDEVTALTRRKRAAAQRRALDRMGLVYMPDAEGRPRVLRSLVERMMGGEPATTEPELELCLEPPAIDKKPSATVRVLQARRLLAREEGQVDAPRNGPR